MDKEAFSICESPHTSERLTYGNHSFKVRAVDRAGNIDQTPGIVRFNVKKN